MKDNEPNKPSEACFACQNMEAYWAEKARRDPALRERIAELERLRFAVSPAAPAGDDEREEPDPGGGGPATD
jgi:hypothetical protein